MVDFQIPSGSKKCPIIHISSPAAVTLIPFTRAMSPQPRIAVVGGGPGGLILGVLHKRSVPFTIFELRPKPTEQELAMPSGMLDLHAGSGLDAIEGSGLYDNFIPLTGDCVEAMWLSDRNGHIVL